MPKFRASLIALLLITLPPAAHATEAGPMPLQLSEIHERAWLEADGMGAIHALADGSHPFDETKEPLIVVHGLRSPLLELQDLVRRFAASPRYQLYLFAYDSFHRHTSRNGDDLAAGILARFEGRPVTIFAHSLGGIVARRALQSLRPAATRFPSLRLYAADSPWHGFIGPSDASPDLSAIVRFSLLFFPAGLMDMRAGSWMFRSPQDGLNTSPLASNMEIHLAFSRDGRIAQDYRKGRLRSLAWQCARWASGQAPEPTGSFQLQNYWAALKVSAEFPAFGARLEELNRAGRLEMTSALDALAAFFPEYPSDHCGMLYERTGEHSYLDALSEALK